MKPTQALIPLMAVLSVMMGAARPGVHRAVASEPGMNYWFSEEITLGTTELPPGVEIRVTDPALQPRALLSIENNTNSMLYVMSLAYKDVLVMTTPDANWERRVNGAQEAASYLAAPTHSARLDIPALTDLDKNLEDRNVSSGDPPPENVTIPEAQSSELLLVYGEQVIEVPFTLTYNMNTHFDNGSPVTTPASVQAASNANPLQQALNPTESTSRYGLLAAGLALIFASAWLIWKGMRHSR